MVNTWLRNSLYSTFGVLWLTGCVWLVLHFFFQTASDFGSAPHPLQQNLLLIHGVVAVVAVFFFGWMAGNHVEAHWRRGMNRNSGLTLITLVAVLALTGLGSYYLTTESLRTGTAFVHEVLGAVAILPALIHWVRPRSK